MEHLSVPPSAQVAQGINSLWNTGTLYFNKTFYVYKFNALIKFEKVPFQCSTIGQSLGRVIKKWNTRSVPLSLYL